MSSGQELHEYLGFTGRQRRDTALHVLEGLLEGLALDHVINLQEHRELRDWIAGHELLAEKDIAFKELLSCLKGAIADGKLTEEEIQDLRMLCQRAKTDSSYYESITHAIQELHGILHGVIADTVINDVELRGLQTWLEDYHPIRDIWPIGEVESVVTEVLADGRIDAAEHRLMLHYFSQFADCSTGSLLKQQLPQLQPGDLTIVGICAVDPDILFDGRVFCFTGISSRGPRAVFAEAVAKKRGTFIDRIRDDLDYLVIGDEGNPCWAFTCYGRKVEAVVEMRKRGHRVQLIHERDFWDA